MLTEQQKEARKGRITSSVVAAILEMDEYTSPYGALLKIQGEEFFEGNKATERGDLLEPALLTYAARELGMEYKKAPFVAGKDGWSGDSADGLLCYPKSDEVVAVVEAKTVNAYGRAHWGDPGTDDVPQRVLAQAHWHLIHWPTAQYCYVPVLFGGDFVFELYAVPRDPEFEKYLVENAKSWHDRHVAGSEPVPISASDADRQALLAMHPRDWLEMLPWDEKIEALVLEKLAAEKVHKAAEKDLNRVSNQLRERLGEHEGVDALQAGYSVTYRKNKDTTRVDWAGVAREFRPGQDLILQHTKIEPGARVLRVARRAAPKKRTEINDVE